MTEEKYLIHSAIVLHSTSGQTVWVLKNTIHYFLLWQEVLEVVMPSSYL